MTPLRYATLFLLLASVAACDSSDPIDQPDPEDITGIYSFTELSFQPTGAAIAPADVLARLDSTRTQLLLSGNDSYFLFYQFRGGPFYTLLGEYEVTSQRIRLHGDPADREDYLRILLEEEFTLQRSGEPGVLTANIQKSVNLEAFDPQQYAGGRSVPGTLRIRLEEQ